MNKLLLDDIISDAKYIKDKTGVNFDRSIQISIEIRKLELHEKFLESFREAHVLGYDVPGALEKIAIEMNSIKK